MVFEFAAAFPGLMRPDGVPVSWAHFVLGMAKLGRIHAGNSLRMAGALSVPQMKKEDADRWYRSQTTAAGW